MSREVFVISAPEDDAIALQIARELEAHQITCWPSTHDTAQVLGDREAELAAQADARITVVIVSAKANASRQVQADVQRAIDSQKMLLPYRTDDAPLSGAMELLLRRRYTVLATGKVEAPLQDLVRIVKPLAGQRQGKRALGASDSRTLPQRTVVLGGMGTAPISREPMGPFQAAVKCEGVLEAGGVSELEVVLANQGSKTLCHVEVELESATLNSSPCENIGDLAAGTQVHLVFAIRPMRLGPSVLRLTIRGTDGGLQFAYMGSRALRVSDASEPTLRAKTKSLDSVTVRETFGSTVQPKIVLPETFDPLELVLDHAHSFDAECAGAERLDLTIPFAYLQQRQDGTLLTLEEVDTTSNLPSQEIKLNARPRFVLGRSREESDLLLWFWPRNEIHDTKTLRVSKRHCTFSLEEGRCLVRGSATAGATLLDDAPVDESGAQLKRRGTLNIAGHYFLDVTHLPAPLRDPVITNLAEWKGPVADAPREARGCVRFVPITANVLPQAAVWVLSEATFGTSRSNGIVLEHEELAEIQGRFHYLQGCFWVENCVDNGAVKVDDSTVKPGTIVPLVTGKILKLGSKRYRPKIHA